MEELKKAVGEMYERFGHNEVTVALSQYLDCLVVEEQKQLLIDLKQKGELENA